MLLVQFEREEVIRKVTIVDVIIIRRCLPQNITKYMLTSYFASQTSGLANTRSNLPCLPSHRAIHISWLEFRNGQGGRKKGKLWLPGFERGH